jgi:hypothetical protein
MTTEEFHDAWYVSDDGKIVAGPFVYNAEAWRWIDRHCGESESMPEKLDPSLACCGVKDRAAVDARQIELILKTAMWKAIQTAMPEIEDVLRETYADP